MAQALRLAERGMFTTTPNPRVGCVIVREGSVVGQGWHERAGEAHAEVHALRMAGDAARGATAYVTLEPCSHHGRTPPCANALMDAGVSRVVAAMRDPNPLVAGRGLALLTLAGVRVEVGLLEAEAAELNIGFVMRMTRARPWVRVKTASSLDGKTALENGESKWITAEAARADVHRLRARACALLTGVGTVLADDPHMNVRGLEVARQPVAWQPVARQPLRVVVDSQLRTPPDARILQEEGAWLVCSQADVRRRDALLEAGAQILQLPGRDGRIDLSALMKELADRGLNEIHVEAGATLNGSLLSAGLVDEWVAYLAPLVMGHHAHGLFDMPALASMTGRRSFDLVDSRQIGRDLRLTLRFSEAAQA